MKKNKFKLTHKYLIAGLFALAFAFFTTCSNPIMEKWWPEPSGTPKKITEAEPGGSGANFGVVRFNLGFEPILLLGEGPQPKDLQIAYGSVVGRLRPITRSGYGFGGWLDEKGNVWDVETRPVLQSDVNAGGFIVLTAQWNLSFYQVSFVANSLNTVITVPPQLVANPGGKAVEPVSPVDTPTPPVSPLGFAGWYTDGYDYQDPPADVTPYFNNPWNFNTVVPGKMTLYAKWDTDTRTINFHDENGTIRGTRPDGVIRQMYTQTISLSSLYIQDPGPFVMEGYSLDGWYIGNNTTSTFTDKWDFATSQLRSTDPTTFDLWAKWIPNKYIVKFVTTPSTTVIDDKIVPHGTPVAQPADPPQLGDGRGFAGWYTVNGDINPDGWATNYLWDFNTAVTSSMTLYARWMPQTRTVHFEVNGGNDMSRTNFTIPIVSGVLLDPGNPGRTGYTFGGWYTDPACTGHQWNFSADRITTPDVIIAMDAMYLYARWTPTYHTVTFNANGGSPAPTAQNIAYGERVKEPPIMSQTGKGFGGWYTNSAFTGDPYNFDNGVISSFTLYAKWDDSFYTVTFDLRNPPNTPLGDPPPVQRVIYNGKVTEPLMPPPAPTDTTSYGFYRWDYDDNGTLRPWVFDTMTVSSSITLYARWVHQKKPDMIWVPKGSFIMGDSGVSGTPAAYHAYPTRLVTVDGFYISRYEVPQITRGDTNPAYQEIMHVNPSQFSRNDARPVERVSWYDAVAYCIALTDSAGLDRVYAWTRGPISATTALSGTNSQAFPIIDGDVEADFTKNGYRLPTEAEWEYAAKGGNGMGPYLMYAGSNNPDEVAWYNVTVQSLASGVQCTQVVGQKKPNALGIYDMSGNVSEWCWDWFAPYKDLIQGLDPSPYDNPRGPDSVLNHYISGVPNPTHVRRGGGWSNAAGNVRSVVRNSDTPDTATWVNGFRVVCGPSAPDIY